MKSLLVFLALCSFSSAKFYQFDLQQQLQAWIELVEKVHPDAYDMFKHFPTRDVEDGNGEFSMNRIMVEGVKKIQVLKPTENMVDTNQTWTSMLVHLAVYGLELKADELTAVSVSPKTFTNVRFNIDKVVFAMTNNFHFDATENSCNLNFEVGLGDFEGVRFFSEGDTVGQTISSDTMRKVIPSLNRALNEYHKEGIKYPHCVY